jgi:hypothetical protein
MLGRGDPDQDVCQSCHHKRWEHFGLRAACQAKGKAYEPRGPDSVPCTCAAFVEQPKRKRKTRGHS